MEAKVRKHLSSFLTSHSLQDAISNIDEIVLSYLFGVLELIRQGEVEDCFDLEDVMDMMNAYLPGFDQIERSIVMEWMFKQAAQLNNFESEEDIEHIHNAEEHSQQNTVVSEEKEEEKIEDHRKSSFPLYDYKANQHQASIPSVNAITQNQTDLNKHNTKTDSLHRQSETETSDDSQAIKNANHSSNLHPIDSHTKDKESKQTYCKKKKRYLSCSSQDSQDDLSRSEIQAELDECLVRNLLEMFPATCSLEAKHCLHVSNGDLNVAAQLIIDRQESGQTITQTRVKSGKHVRKSKKSSSDIKLDDDSIKSCVIERYSFYDVAEEEKTHKPPPLKNEAKKLVRYRDNQIVSMKGERFSEIKKS